MATPPSPLNYQIGGVSVILGGLDLGNVAGFEIDPSDIEVKEHVTHRSGAGKIDKKIITQKRLTFTYELDEHQVDLYKKFFMGGGGATTVFPLTSPLLETNAVITYRNESAVIWTYSHTKVVTQPEGAMDFGEFDDFVPYSLVSESLEDAVGSPSSPHGIFTFT